MNVTIAGWSLTGIAAAILIVAGITLLAVYMFRRGLHHRGLDGTEDGGAEPGVEPAAAAAATSRTMGAAGAAVLVLGLALGVIAATGGWGTQQTAGPGIAPEDCAQTWTGCPQATIAP